MIIRLMDINDIAKVAKVERACFSDPWSAFSFENELENEQTTYVVAIKGEEIVGYGGMRYLADEGHIMKTAVCPQYRRQRVADGILKWLEKYCKKRGIIALTLEVRKSNVGAIKLYKKRGFKREGVRKEYYRNPEEDAVIMWKYFDGRKR